MSNAFLNLNAEMMTLIFERDSLNDGQSEVFIYLALLRWARRSGTLDANDPSQFDTTEVLQSERLLDLKKLMKLVRLPIIPAEILVNLIYPGKLVEMEDLFLATAF
jgi:hypothetical protein